MTSTAVSTKPGIHRPRGEIARYGVFERMVHWEVAVTFIALMLSGLALAYPRMAWLAILFGGGQTMRAAHPWIGVAFVLGIVVMIVMWGRAMLLDRVDRVWMRNVMTYARSAHTGLDIGRWNAGQKGYFWISIVGAVILLVTGIPLWFPDIAGTGVREWARLIHHAVFLLSVAGFIVHVLLSAFMFPGTMAAMTSGRVTRAWAAWHHPRWFREQTGIDGDGAGDAGDGEPAE